jgi:hypothetical protein
MIRREFMKWLARLTGGYIAMTMASPLRQINTVFFQEAHAGGCGQDTCRTRDACATGDAGHTCETRDVCDVDESKNCRMDQCLVDQSGPCLEDECGSDKSGSCNSDRCASDESGSCASDLCSIDSSGQCSGDKCGVDKSGGCISDWCQTDKSGGCQGDNCLTDGSGSCKNDSCRADRSGQCQGDTCETDKSGDCVTDTCQEDKSGSCLNDTCGTDASGKCSTDLCTSDNSGSCASDQCTTDSSSPCSNDTCNVDNDTCAQDTSCPVDQTIICPSDGCAADCLLDGFCPVDGIISSRLSNSGSKTAGATLNRAMRWLYRLSMILLFLFPVIGVPVGEAAVFNVAAGDTSGLIAAVTQANATGGADTINLGAGVYSFTEGDENDLIPALPMITSPITINGSSSGTTTLERNAGASSYFNILSIGAGGNLTLNRLKISGGVVSGMGGGILNGGTLLVRNCTVSGNSAGETGGGIGNFEGILTIVDSAITGNSSPVGGGIAGVGGAVTITNTTFYGNTSTASVALGGGIASVSSAMTIVNTTVSGNSATPEYAWSIAYGGGVFGSMNLVNTIVAKNTCISAPDMAGWPVSLGHNLIGDLVGSFWVAGAGDLSGAAGLRSFADNGTPGNGHLPISGSSKAVDRADNTRAPAADQLGTLRPQGKGPDIGAFECLETNKAVPGLMLLLLQ